MPRMRGIQPWIHLHFSLQNGFETEGPRLKYEILRFVKKDEDVSLKFSICSGMTSSTMQTLCLKLYSKGLSYWQAWKTTCFFLVYVQRCTRRCFFVNYAEIKCQILKENTSHNFSSEHHAMPWNCDHPMMLLILEPMFCGHVRELASYVLGIRSYDEVY